MGKNKKRIQQNRAAKRARAASRKQKRKRNQNYAQGSRYADLGYSRGEIVRAPVHEVCRSKNLFEMGWGEVLFSRRMPDGQLAVGIFMLDIYCLGIKDALLTVMSESDYITKKDEWAEDGFLLESVSPEYAKKLIESSVAYAAQFSLSPHQDYREASVVLDGVDASACTDEFTFGKDGKPFFVASLEQSRPHVLEIVQRLTNVCGPEGFHYLLPVEPKDVPDDLEVVDEEWTDTELEGEEAVDDHEPDGSAKEI